MVSRNKKRYLKRVDEVNRLGKRLTFRARKHYSLEGVERTGLKNLPGSGMSKAERIQARLGAGGLFNGGHDWTIEDGTWRKLTQYEKGEVQVVNKGLINFGVMGEDERWTVKGKAI